MGKILTLAVVLAAAVTFGSATGAAVPATDSPRSMTACDVEFLWDGQTACVSVVDVPGSSYAVYNEMGMPLARGVLNADRERFLVGSAGAAVFLVVNDEIVAGTDPDWEWN